MESRGFFNRVVPWFSCWPNAANRRWPPDPRQTLARPLRKVLVADDDPAMRHVVARILDTSGYEVRVAADGREAIRMIAADPPDFLITDWEMPECNRLELCACPMNLLQKPKPTSRCGSCIRATGPMWR